MFYSWEQSWNNTRDYLLLCMWYPSVPVCVCSSSAGQILTYSILLPFSSYTSLLARCNKLFPKLFCLYWCVCWHQWTCEWVGLSAVDIFLLHCHWKNDISCFIWFCVLQLNNPVQTSVSDCKTPACNSPNNPKQRKSLDFRTGMCPASLVICRLENKIAILLNFFLKSELFPIPAWPGLLKLQQTI